MKFPISFIAILVFGFISGLAPTINSQTNSKRAVNSASRSPAGRSTNVRLADLLEIRKDVLSSKRINPIGKATLVIDGSGDLSQQLTQPIDLNQIEEVESNVRNFQILQYFEQDTQVIRDLIPQIFGDEALYPDGVVYGVVDPEYQTRKGSHSGSMYPTSVSGRPGFYYRTVSKTTGIPILYPLLNTDYGFVGGYEHINSMSQSIISSGSPAGKVHMTISENGHVLKFGNMVYRRVEALSTRVKSFNESRDNTWRPDLNGKYTSAIVYTAEDVRKLSGIRGDMADSYAFAFYKNKSGQEKNIIYITAIPRFSRQYDKSMIFLRFDKENGSIQQFDINYDKNSMLHRMLFTNLKGVARTSSDIQPLINPETGETLGGIIVNPNDIELTHTAERSGLFSFSADESANIGTLIGLQGEELLEARSVADLILKPLAPRIVQTMDPFTVWTELLGEAGFAKFGDMKIQLGAVGARAVEATFDEDVILNRPPSENVLGKACIATLKPKKIR